jgi:hypothetical protein
MIILKRHLQKQAERARTELIGLRLKISFRPLWTGFERPGSTKFHQYLAAATIWRLPLKLKKNTGPNCLIDICLYLYLKQLLTHYGIRASRFFHNTRCFRPVRRTDNLTTSMCRLPINLRSSTSWGPQGLSRICFTFYALSSRMEQNTGFSPLTNKIGRIYFYIFRLPNNPSVGQ